MLRSPEPSFPSEQGGSTNTDDPLSDPLLRRFWPSEARAILVHRYYLSIGLRRQATLEETILSWENGAGGPWRNQKQRRDCEAQIQAIQEHKYFLSEKAGYNVGFETAAQDWILHHAAQWRKWWEGTKHSGA